MIQPDVDKLLQSLPASIRTWVMKSAGRVFPIACSSWHFPLGWRAFSTAIFTITIYCWCNSSDWDRSWHLLVPAGLSLAWVPKKVHLGPTPQSDAKRKVLTLVFKVSQGGGELQFCIYVAYGPFCSWRGSHSHHAPQEAGHSSHVHCLCGWHILPSITQPRNLGVTLNLLFFTDQPVGAASPPPPVTWKTDLSVPALALTESIALWSKQSNLPKTRSGHFMVLKPSMAPWGSQMELHRILGVPLISTLPPQIISSHLSMFLSLCSTMSCWLLWGPLCMQSPLSGWTVPYLAPCEYLRILETVS